jgi:hypothetical protein
MITRPSYSAFFRGLAQVMSMTQGGLRMRLSQNHSWVSGLEAFFILCILLGATHLANAQTPDETPKSVWLVKQLSCNGFVAHQLIRSPDAAEIGSTGIVKIPNMQMEFIIPGIPELPIKTIRLVFDDRGRKVVDHYILLSLSDLDDPLAAVMVTELPPSFDTSQKALEAAIAGERSNLQG